MFRERTKITHTLVALYKRKSISTWTSIASAYVLLSANTAAAGAPTAPSNFHTHSRKHDRNGYVSYQLVRGALRYCFFFESFAPSLYVSINYDRIYHIRLPHLFSICTFQNRVSGRISFVLSNWMWWQKALNSTLDWRRFWIHDFRVSNKWDFGFLVVDLACSKSPAHTR